MSILATSLGAGASVLGSLFNFGSQKSSNKANLELAAQQNQYNQQLQDRQFQHDIQQNEYAYAQNLAQWNRENEYNSPASQIQRYIDAGLNPNLIYGSGTSAGVSGSSPQMTAARYQSPTAQRATNNPARIDFDPYQAISLSNQLAIQRAQADNLEAQADYTSAQAERQRYENEIDLPVRSSLLNNQSTLAYAQGQKAFYEVDRIREDSRFIRAKRELLPFQEQLLKQQLKNLKTSHDIDTLRYELQKLGVNDRDDLWQRIAARLFVNFGGGAKLNSVVNNLFK